MYLIWRESPDWYTQLAASRFTLLKTWRFQKLAYLCRCANQCRTKENTHSWLRYTLSRREGWVFSPNLKSERLGMVSLNFFLAALLWKTNVMLVHSRWESGIGRKITNKQIDRLLWLLQILQWGLSLSVRCSMILYCQWEFKQGQTIHAFYVLLWDQFDLNMTTWLLQAKATLCCLKIYCALDCLNPGWALATSLS